MTTLNPGEVILPVIHVLLVLPGGDRPYAWQAAAIDPHSRPLVAIGLAGNREEGRNGVVQLLSEPGVGAVRSDGDAVGRIREGEVIHHVVANGLAELADHDTAGLAPEFTNGTQVVVTPPKTAVGWAEHPGVIGKAHHGAESLGQVDVAADIFFTPVGGHIERLGEVVASAWIRVGRSRIGLEYKLCRWAQRARIENVGT